MLFLFLIGIKRIYEAIDLEVAILELVSARLLGLSYEKADGSRNVQEVVTKDNDLEGN